MADEWHYTRGGEQTGPVTWAELKRLADEKTLVGTDLVWNADMPEWAEARTVPGLMPAKGPPPLPKRSTEPTKATVAATGTALSSQVLSGEASYKVVMEPYTGGNTSSDADKVDVAIDGRKLGSGSLRNGFQLFCGIRACVGVHKLTLAQSAGVGAKLLGMFGKQQASKFSEESYRIEFPEPGDYVVQFRFDETRGELDYPSEAVAVKQGEVQGIDVLAKKGFALIGKGFSALANGLKSREESSRRSQLYGLWQPATGGGTWFLFTKDGAMLRADGLATKFRWADDQTVELYEDGCATVVPLAVLSLGKNELIVKADAQAGHFYRTDSITQAEERRRQEEAERARAEFLAKAGTVAAVLAIGGIAVLCGVAATAATLDSGAGGGTDRHDTPTTGSKPSAASAAATKVLPAAPPSRKEAVALRGAVVTGYQGSQAVIRHKCEACGTVQPGQTVMSFSSAVTSGGFSCHRCHSQQEYAIQGM